MSRTGVEAKLPWRQVPKAVRQQVEAALGAPVRRAARIWGGYGPAPSFRLLLADGRRAFFKGTYGESNEFSQMALIADERAYQELNGLLGRWMADYYATIAQDDWRGLLLEDLGPKSVPPWTPLLARGISQAMADFHRATLGVALPKWIPHPPKTLISYSWRQVADNTQDFHLLAELAGTASAEAQAWLNRISPIIEDLMTRPILATEPFALLHGDLRSDNLRFRQGRLKLFDWPAISAGRPEWDIVVFAQTVTVEGGVLPEQIIQWYAEKLPVDAAAVDSSIAWWFCFFADKAWREEIPGLPRVRRFQRQQLAVIAQWAARQWALPEPAWAQGLLK